MQGNNIPNINVDTSSNTTTNSGTVGGIISAGNTLRGIRESIPQKINETNDSTELQLQNILNIKEKINKETDEETKKLLEKSKAYKDLVALEESLTKNKAEFNKMLKDGNVSIDTFLKANQSATNDLADAIPILAKVNILMKNKKELQEGLTKDHRNFVAQLETEAKQEKEIAKQEKKHVEDIVKESNKSLGKAVGKAAKSMRETVTSLRDTFNIDKIASTLDTSQSSASQIQQQIQYSYNLNKSQFKDFKRDINNSIDTSIYSATEVRNMIGQLQDLGISNEKEAVARFDTLMTGQHILGMSGETQKKLLELGNKTGRDQLTFSTNKVATYLKMSQHIGQKQLDELTSMNAAFKSDMFNVGLDSQEFGDMIDSATFTLTDHFNDGGTYAKNLEDATASLANSTDLSANMLGMSADQFKAQQQQGKSLPRMIMESNGKLNSLYTAMMQNGGATPENWDILADSLGIDQSARNLVKAMGAYYQQTGGSLADMIDENVRTGASAKDAEEKKKQFTEGTSYLGKKFNRFENWVSQETDWTNFDNISKDMGIIVGLLASIEGVIKAQEVLGIIKSGFGKVFSWLGKTKLGTSFTSGLGKAGSWLAGTKLGTSIGSAGTKLAGTKVGALLTSTVGSKLVQGAGVLGGIASIGAMGYDAFQSYQHAEENYGEGHKLGATLSGIFGGKDVQRDKDGKTKTWSTVGSSALNGLGKGAGVGATIGTFVGGPIGTAIGGAIGAGVGALGGALSGWWKSSQAKKQDEISEKQLKAQEKIADNTASAAKSLKQTQESSRNIRAYRPGYGGPTGSPVYSSPSSSSLLTKQGTGGSNGPQYPKGSSVGPWLVTGSYKGPDYPKHTGIDLSGSQRAIYAAQGGTVDLVQKWNGKRTSGDMNSYGNLVIIKGNNGKSYYYAHLNSALLKTGDKVSAGEPVGYMGNTGNVYPVPNGSNPNAGTHLHFEVRNGKTDVSPEPYLTSSLWSGDGSAGDAGSGTLTDTSNSLKDGINKKDFNQVYSVKLGQGGPTGIPAYSSPSASQKNQDEESAIVKGLADIKQTLIDLSDRQTRDEKILNMLQGKQKQEPRIS